MASRAASPLLLVKALSRSKSCRRIEVVVNVRCAFVLLGVADVIVVGIGYCFFVVARMSLRHRNPYLRDDIMSYDQVDMT